MSSSIPRDSSVGMAAASLVHRNGVGPSKLRTSTHHPYAHMEVDSEST